MNFSMISTTGMGVHAGRKNKDEFVLYERGSGAAGDVLKQIYRRCIVARMTPMNPKSASALAWLALGINILGLIVTALEAQFVFSAFAAVLVLYPAIFAGSRARIFPGAVLILSLVLAVAGYPKFIQSPYMQRITIQK
jgi:hypothetical protein